jgi:tetratricopeptide (TPR) repeat protein
VFDQTEGTRHLPFFAELAALEDGDPSWRAVSAGLVVLRLVDAWIEEGAAAVAADGWGMRSVEAAIEEVDDGVPARAVLRSVVTALKGSQPNDMRGVAPRLMAYGRSLDLDAKWALAADVYETVIAHVHPLEESDVAISAHLRRAYCQRSLGALEDASTSYDAASSIAGSIGDIFGMLRAQIGSATIAKTRGNIPEAEALLDDAIARAESHELTDVRALALQDRADIAYLRGNYDLAVRVAYEALEHTKDPVNRDRILSDIATSFYMLGVRSVARDTYLIIEATAQEQYARWVASINLMEIAAQDGSMPLFERYRKLLSSADLPPLLRAQFLLHLGEGYAALGETSLAEAALTTASDLAGKYALNQLSFTIEESIRRVVDMANNPTQPETDVPPSLVGIARDLGALRRQLAKPL